MAEVFDFATPTSMPEHSYALTARGIFLVPADLSVDKDDFVVTGLTIGDPEYNGNDVRVAEQVKSVVKLTAAQAKCIAQGIGYSASETAYLKSIHAVLVYSKEVKKRG